MKRLFGAACLIVITGSLALAQNGDAAVKKDKELLKGVWKIESFENQEGKNENYKGATLEFKAE